MVSIFSRMAFILVILQLAGCASGVAYKESSANMEPISNKSGRIFFYRPSSMGAIVQPAVYLNKDLVGSAVPQGYFYVDRPAGNYEVTTTTEVKKSLTFHLSEGQSRYVRLDVSMGLFVGHVYPELVDSEVALKELRDTKSVKE